MRKSILRLAGSAALASLPLLAAPSFAQTCAPVGQCGDVDGSGLVLTSDALKVLRRAVGQNVSLICNCSEGSCSTSLATCNSNLASCQTNLAACEAAGHFPATGQTTSYGTGDDGDLEEGETLAYTDNGDGTITDENTGLVWEKKILGGAGLAICNNETGTCANPHDVENRYSWSVSGNTYDGTIVTLMLNQLNHRCDKNPQVPCSTNADCNASGGACGFAGHHDWRLPNKKELESILDLELTAPSLDAAFHGASCGNTCLDMSNPACSCDASAQSWSSTTFAANPAAAFLVNFANGYASAFSKTGTAAARAVRGPE